MTTAQLTFHATNAGVIATLWVAIGFSMPKYGNLGLRRWPLMAFVSAHALLALVSLNGLFSSLVILCLEAYPAIDPKSLNSFRIDSGGINQIGPVVATVLLVLVSTVGAVGKELLKAAIPLAFRADFAGP